MRELNKAQKKLLDKWYFENAHKIQRGIAFFDLGKCDCFPLEFLEELERINDFETIHAHINNYISEKAGSKEPWKNELARLLGDY